MRLHRHHPLVLDLERRDLLTIGGQTVIAVLGSGTAPVGILAGHVLPGLSVLAPGQPGNVDPRGHDTATASIALGEALRFDPTAQILPIVIADTQGVTNSIHMVDGIREAVDAGADVIAISYASDPYVRTKRVTLSTPIDISPDSPTMQYAWVNNVPVIVSAGNVANNNDINHVWPASDGGLRYLSNVIAVAATDNLGTLQSWSNYGRRTVTLAAPGVNIPITTLDGSEATASGSSVAAPLVAGLVAGIRHQRPTEFVADILADLRSVVTRTASTLTSTRFGGSLLATEAVPPQTQKTPLRQRPTPLRWPPGPILARPLAWYRRYYRGAAS